MSYPNYNRLKKYWRINMKYITIADLKKMAKKERKKNNNIKNHADSLNLIANKNNFSNWSELIDNAVLIKSNKEISEKDKKEILSEVIDNIMLKLHEIKNIFSTNNPETLSIYINNNFLNSYVTKKDCSWNSRSKIFMESFCFIYTNFTLEKNIYMFKEMLHFNNLLSIIKEKKLFNDPQIKKLFDLILYKNEYKGKIPDIVLEQYGYLIMSYMSNIKFIDLIIKIFGFNLDLKREEIKNIILKEHNILTYRCNGNNILDKNNLFLNYKNSFDNEKDFLLDLEKNLF